MARKIFGGEAVPKIFQTFNSLLGGIVRKRNATIVGPSKQLVGEFPEVNFERLYQYYHHWDQIKTAVDVMHQKFRGSGIKIKSNNEYFNVFIEKWWDVSNSEKKWSQYIYSLLITGSAIMELQYTPQEGNRQPRLGNIEQIPMQTIYRLFRDQFGNELKIVQIVDGVFKELDPQYFIHSTINNPDRQAFGKSMFHTLATPRPITGTVDPISGDPINSARQSMPLLDAQAELQNAEIEIKKKMAKPRMLVSALGMPKPQMDQIQAEMADPNTDQYIWIFDKPITSAELQVQANGKFEEYGTNVDAHIDVGTIFASNVIKNPQGFSYSGGQTPFDVLDQRMMDLQSELIETVKDRLLKPLAESWGFMDFDAMEVEVSFTPTMKRLTMEDIRGLDPLAVSKKEIRAMYKALNIPLDDKLWEEEQKELKQDKQDQKNIQMQGALTGGMDPTTGKPAMGAPPAGGDPFSPKPDEGSAKSGSVKAPKVSEPKTGEKSPFEMDRPKPTPNKTPQPTKKGENLHQKLIKQIANENLTPKQMIDAIRAVERIPLPPSAISDSADDYVSQGIDDEEEKPEITDPKIREEFGLDKDENELPPTDPSKMARGSDRPALQPADNTGGRFTNAGAKGIPQIPHKSEAEYLQHLQASQNGNEIIGGTGSDGINSDSDGSFKDPTDANNDLEVTPDTPQANSNPHPRPNEPPMVNKKPVQMSGGSDALPNNTNEQILGANTDDEEPIIPVEGDPRELKKGEARAQPNPVLDNRDIIEGEDPLTSGTSQDPNNEPEPYKQQARLDDSPLQNPSANKGNIDGINPTTAEDPNKLANNDSESPNNMVPPFDKLGDSGQVRLNKDELTGIQQDPLKPNDSKDILDNTGLNVTPQFRQVSQDDYLKRVQDGSNPLEKLGEPLQDGMVIKPEDVQQYNGVSKSPNTPTGTTALDQDPNTVNDPSDSGIEEEQVDPNILHQDPETGINYTDLTDEQGNEVPDLRWDQTPTSDEEQPTVELEYEIVTKEEYDQHLDSSKGQQLDPTNNPMDPALDNPDLVGVSDKLTGEFPETGSGSASDRKTFNSGQKTGEEPKSDSNPKEKSAKSQPTSSKSDKKLPDINDDNMSGSAPSKTEPTSDKKINPRGKTAQGKNTKSDKKEKNTGQDTTKEKTKKSDKKEKVPVQDELDTEDLPETSGDVDNIIKREHELIDKGVPEDEIHDILLDEFGEDKVANNKKGDKNNEK